MMVADSRISLDDCHGLAAALHRRYHYDFRAYAPQFLHRSLSRAVAQWPCRSLADLQAIVMTDAPAFTRLLGYLTVQVSEMFRTPAYFLALRQQVVPHLATYPSLKVWVAGCSTGEEAYSLAILLREEGLLERTLIYATDIHPDSLSRAEKGIYAGERLPGYSRNYQLAGGRRSLSDYYTAAYGRVILDRSLARHIVFSDHDLATDSVFGEMHLVSCRNVLIYFTPELQDRACGLFRESLVPRGFLGLGHRETLRFSRYAADFATVDAACRLYRRRPC